MEKPVFSKTKINTNGQQFIQVDAKKWEDGMVVGRQTGFIEVQPEHADNILGKLNNGELITTFGDKNLATGLFEVQTVKKSAV